MLISGANSCTSCIIHNPDKIIEIFINIEKQSTFAKLIEQNKLNNKTRLLKKNDFNRLGIKNDRFIGDIVIRREKYKPFKLEEIIINTKKSLIIIADQITDQNNLGNIIRTALLMGADGLLLSEHSSADINDVTSITSSGAVEVLKYHVSKNINRTIEVLKKSGYWTYSLDMSGEEMNREFNFDKKSVIIVGNEGKGIRRNILAKSDFKISIPQENVDGIDSYNAVNSLAIAAYHFKISTF
jgi:23S rRNA (guanosine2251-2'-O)-methyltransferase